MIEQLIARVLIARVQATLNAAKMRHCRGPSYPQHMILDRFIGDANEALDDLAESFQGCHGPINFDAVPTIQRPRTDDVLAAIEAEMRWIASAREQISDDPAVLSLVDVLSIAYQRTVYLLRQQK